MRLVYLFICFFIGAYSHLHGQVHFYVENDSMTLGEERCVPVRVNGFSDVDAFQFSVNFDPYLLRLNRIGDVNAQIELRDSDIGITGRRLGRITALYTSAQAARTLPDSAVLFSMCFTPYGPITDTLCPINITSTPLAIQVIQDLQVAPFITTDARIDVSADDNLAVVATTCPTDGSDTTGSMEIAIFGGTAPYFVLWQNRVNTSLSGGFGLDSTERSRTLTRLGEGSYRITVTDATGLRIRDTVSLVTQTALTYQLDTTLPACDQDLTGAILFDSIMGGFSPIQFKWDDGLLFAEGRDGLAAGTYQVTLTDPSGCRRFETIELTSTRIDATITTEDESCAGASDGEVILIPSGGQLDSDGDYDFEFEGVTSRGAALFAQNLSPGSYTAVASDTSGCQKRFDWSIASGFTQLVDSIAILAVGCEEDALGRIFIRMTRDTGVAFTFEAPDVDSVVRTARTVDLWRLDTGSYTIRAIRQDSLMCVWDTTLRIEQLSPIFVNTVEQTTASCTPGDDGRAEIEITGGQPFSDGAYRIRWITGDTTSVIDNLSPGTYTAEIEDSLGCIAFHDIDITQDGGPVLAAFALQNMRCDTTPSGVLLTTFTSPAGIASYDWSDGQTTPSITGVVPGVYTVTVTTNDNCVDSFDFDAVPPPGPVIIRFDGDSINCPGDSNATLTPVFSPGLAPVTAIIWNDTLPSDTLRQLAAGDYVVTLIDANGCQVRDTATLEDPDSLAVEFETTPIDVDVPGSIMATVSGGRQPYQYTWSPGTLPDTSIISVFTIGTYTLLATDASGCTLLDSVMVDGETSTLEAPSDEIAQIYPNPATSNITIKTSEADDARRVVITDMAGHVLARQMLPNTSNGEHFMHIDHIPAGRYLVKIIHEMSEPVVLPLVIVK